jgi:hypothetical protein
MMIAKVVDQIVDDINIITSIMIITRKPRPSASRWPSLIQGQGTVGPSQDGDLSPAAMRSTET